MKSSGSNSSGNGREAEHGLAESDRIVAAARTATAEAVRQHKLLGESIAVWCDGRVVVLLSGEIPESFKDIEVTARLKLRIIDSLRELSDRKEQERLWFSTGAGGSDVSSFTEAFCGLFDDTGLGDNLDKGTTGLGSAADAALEQLYVELRNVDQRAGPKEIIESGEMKRIRELAAVALRLVEPGS
jgi:hypothetical protein